MKTASAATLAILNSTNRFNMADLYTVTLWDGTVLRWTSYDLPITVGGNTFASPADQDTAVPVISRGKTRSERGLVVGSLDVTLATGGHRVQLGGIGMGLAARNGAFDGAMVLLERAFMPTPGVTTPGTIILFKGFVAGVDPSSTLVVLRVKSDLDKLTVAMPRNTFAPNCTHVLFDTGCALSRAAFQVTGTVAAGATTLAFNTSLSQADGYFNLGVLVMTSGPATGSRRAVKSYLNASGAVVLTVVLPVAPGNGNTFTIVPGCDKTQATCTTKFTNLQHFRGFPFVPKPESARGVGP